MIKMNFNQSERRLRVTIAVLLISVISTFPVAFSQTMKAQTPSKASARAESKGGQVEGIKVHGHWIIDVRNPDGKLVTHREFENALVPGNPLARILARQQTVGVWGIFLSAQGPPCALSSGVVAGCLIAEPSFFANDSNIFKNLTLSVPLSGTNANALVLSGTATATRAGRIESVLTEQIGLANMTETSLAIPIDVSNGQIVQVTVVISFS